jgi:hypothetical protein
LLYFTSTSTNGHVFDVRVNDRVYTIVVGTGSDLYCDKEAVAPLTAALAAADSTVTLHTRSE